MALSKHLPPLLHVGYHKTGTTWLQTQLFASDEAGFCTNTHRRDYLYVFVYPHAFEFDPAEARARFEADWLACPETSVPVLSMERFSGTPHAGRYDSAEIARRLHATFPEGRVLIVVREQDDLILSGYRQYVKNSGGLSLDQYLHPPYEPSVIHRFSYEGFHFDRLVAHYDGLFGRENVLVMAYEAFREDPVAYMATIARFAGLDPDPGVLGRLRASERENPSFSALATAIKRRANRVASRRSAINPTPLVELSETSTVLVRRSFYALDRWLPQGVSARLDARQRAFIRAAVGNRYEASNAALAERTGLDLGRYGYQLPETRSPGARPAPEPGADPLTFHIVYTPGTVKLLTPFVASLLAHSPFRFCLVSNGCGPEEQAHLEEVAAGSARLDMLVGPSQEPLLHSEILEWLYDQSSGSHFAFLDSDIFAVAPFGDTVLGALTESPTFFACSQPWSSYFDRSVTVTGPLMGRHLWAAGQRAGTSFFAVYRRAEVDAIHETYGVRFGKYTWEKLPPRAQERLVEPVLRFSVYDTAKALNVLLRADGARIHYDPLPAVVHLGGISARTKGRPSRRHWLKRGPSAWVRVLVRRTMPGIFGRERSRLALAQARRSLSWRYFGAALPAYQAGQPPPPVPDFGDVLVQREMERVIGALADFYTSAPVVEESFQEAA